MTPAQQAALEAIVGRALTVGELDSIEPFIADPDDRNDVQIAAILSTGRTRIETRMIGERGIMATLGTIEGEKCLAALEDFAATDLPETHPLAARHAGIKRMIGWLKTDVGLDIGTPEAHQLLGGMVQLAILEQEWAAPLMALSLKPDPFPLAAVSQALNEAEGRVNL